MHATRRHLLRAGAALGAATWLGRAATAAPARLSLNENPFGPSPEVLAALRDALPQVGRYGDDAPVQTLLDRIARLENIPREQIVLGEILGPLGVFLAGRSPAGGRFVLSVPGYPAVADAARPEGGVTIGVPLNAKLENDLPTLSRAVVGDTRALYLVNPHNPSGTTNAPDAFDAFIRNDQRRGGQLGRELGAEIALTHIVAMRDERQQQAAGQQAGRRTERRGAGQHAGEQAQAEREHRPGSAAARRRDLVAAARAGDVERAPTDHQPDHGRREQCGGDRAGPDHGRGGGGKHRAGVLRHGPGCRALSPGVRRGL